MWDTLRLRPVRFAVRSRIRRLTRTPFDVGAGPAVLVHCAHHKVGTVWFQRVLSTVAGYYGLRFTEVPVSYGRSTSATPAAGVDVVVYDRANDFHPRDLAPRPYRASHLIRDPRDVVVSGYHYHLRTDESWAHEPKDRYGGLSYQAFLRSLDEHDGLMAEIERSARSTLADMAAWTYGGPAILELRYEDAVRDETGTFAGLFRFYGFTDTAVDRGLRIVEQFSRQHGPLAADADPHVRSGEPGEWRRHLGSDHVDRLKELTGDLVIRLGYETDPDW
ncbi:MAG TPA: sulfotransferase domain-containing protein [Acidimicrobiales bacterium]|nr:sulfotransferase domain-containing protein [Acidimicrobiales bacterium]